jgi:hypothetical protein
MADIVDLRRWRTVTVVRDTSGHLPPMTLYEEGALILNRAPEGPLMPRPVPSAVRVARASRINPGFPVYGTPTTITVRDNFQAAKDEIEELQAGKLDVAGGLMTGPIVFSPDQVIDGGTF